MWCWDPGPLEEQPLFLPAEPSLQPHVQFITYVLGVRISKRTSKSVATSDSISFPFLLWWLLALAPGFASLTCISAIHVCLSHISLTHAGSMTDGPQLCDWMRIPPLPPPPPAAPMCPGVLTTWFPISASAWGGCGIFRQGALDFESL